MVHLPARSARGRVGLGWMVSLVAALVFLWGCGESGSPAPAPAACAPGEVATPEGTCRAEEPPRQESCPPGELLLESGACQPAGLPPDMPCPPGEWPSEDGTCQAAGVPPEACAEGFEPDGNGGCNAILPAEACPFGQIAVPGETSCREVAPCGDGPWGTIPVEANTQFVDQAYAGGDSDGTMAKPWTTVQQGVDAAAGGAIVAVTDGVYVEDVRIEGKAVRLWGRCPGRVEIRGTGVESQTIHIYAAGAHGAEIRGLAVTGVGMGIFVQWVDDVRIEQVWVYDAGDIGIAINVGSDSRSVTVQRSLVERNHGAGVFVYMSNVDLSATVVRDTQPLNGQSGRGISTTFARMSIRGCVVERNHASGVFVFGTDMDLSATMVSGQGGWGIVTRNDPDTGELANVSIRGCVVEQNHDVGVLVSGSDLDVELSATVVRDTQPGAERGVGIHVEYDSKVIVRECMVQHNDIQGVGVHGSDAELEATVVRGNGGWGILVRDLTDTGERANVGIRGCVVEQNHELGVHVIGSDAELDATVVRDTQPLDGHFGDGIYIQGGSYEDQRAKARIHECMVEQNHRQGVFVDGSADAELLATVVRGQAGFGIYVIDERDTGERATLSAHGCVLEQNHLIGLWVIGSDAELAATVVRDTQPGQGWTGQGIEIGVDTITDERGKAGLRGCVVEQNRGLGIAIFQSDAAIETTIVRETAADADGNFGDGIGVLNGTATIQSTTVSGSARAGVANFGSDVTILSSTITCNAFDLNGESFDGIPASFEGSADWQCSSAGAEDCTETDTCHVLSAGLAPPPSLDHLPPQPQP